jgi:hypothetical protein
MLRPPRSQTLDRPRGSTALLASGGALVAERFYPLWRDCGQAEVMNRFIRELARHFPRDSGGR